jgi:hypothetical protein
MRPLASRLAVETVAGFGKQSANLAACPRHVRLRCGVGAQGMRGGNLVLGREEVLDVISLDEKYDQVGVLVPGHAVRPAGWDDDDVISVQILGGFFFRGAAPFDDTARGAELKGNEPVIVLVPGERIRCDATGRDAGARTIRQF